MRTTYESEKLAHHKSLFFIPGNAYYHKELTNAGAFASGALEEHWVMTVTVIFLILTFPYRSGERPELLSPFWKLYI